MTRELDDQKTEIDDLKIEQRQLQNLLMNTGSQIETALAPKLKEIKELEKELSDQRALVSRRDEDILKQGDTIAEMASSSGDKDALVMAQNLYQQSVKTWENDLKEKQEELEAMRKKSKEDELSLAKMQEDIHGEYERLSFKSSKQIAELEETVSGLTLTLTLTLNPKP